MKNSTKRKWKKGLAVRAAALTFFATILTVYGVGMYLFSDFVFLSDNRAPATPSAQFLPPEETDSPTLICQTHREQPGADSSTGTADEKNTYGYISLPRSFAQDGETASDALEKAGIPYEIRFCRSTLPAGRVVYLDYAGFSDENSCYVNPDVPVVLTLSGYKKELPEFTGDNMVYLTFDDGPSVHTDRILDTLGLAGIRATFFTLGTSVEKYPAAARRITEDGHLLASHGATHDYDAIYASAGTLLADVQQWQNIAESAGALPRSDTYYFRFPGGSVGSYFGAQQRKNMIDGLHGMGYKVYDWNILTNDGVLFLRPEGMDSLEYLKQSFLETWENCTSDTRIILMHDTVAETAELLPWMIDYIIEQGYTFGTIDMLDTEYLMG